MLPDVAKLDDTGKKDKIFLSKENIAVLQLFFGQLPKYYKIDFKTCSIFVKRPRGPL